MANRLMQQNAGPTRAKHHVHHACGGWDGIKIYQSDAQCFAGFVLPICGIKKAIKADTATAASTSRFATAIFFNYDGYIHAGHGPDITDRTAFGA